MKKKILKIGAFVVALALIVGVCLFANSLLGNPVSKALATHTAKTYLAETYPDREVKLESVSFSFKEGCYYVHVTQPGQMDGDFTLSIDLLGRLRYDNYQDSVLGGWNTARRIGAEYRRAVDAVLDSSSFPSGYHMGYGDLEFISREYKDVSVVPSYALITEDLTPGEAYNLHDLGAKAGKVTIYLCDDTVTAERLAELLLRVREVFDNAGVSFYVIDCILEAADETAVDERIEVMDFLYSDIYEEDLVQRVESANVAAREYYAAQDAEKFG